MTTGDYYAYTPVTGTKFYEQFYVKIASTNITSGSEAYLVTLESNTNSNGSVRIGTYYSGSNNYLRMSYHTAAGWQLDPGGKAISLDTWYGVRVYVNDSTTDTIQWWVDYTDNGTWTDEGTTSGVSLDRTINCVKIGDTSTPQGQASYITGLKIDKNAMLSACTR